jgi:hypothetical protein
MVIDLKRLKIVESSYENSPVSLNALQTMMDHIMHSQLPTTDPIILMSYETLKKMDILIDKPNSSTQLNS